jgi:pilus assembly protein Flp/PilA
MKKFTQRFLRDNRGVTALEYGLIAGMIAVVIGATIKSIGAKMEVAFAAILALFP